MHQPNLFDADAPKYPHSPGFAKKRETSRQAAAHVGKTINSRQQAVLDELGKGAATDHELASRLKKDMCQVQPRRSELTEKGQVIDSGETRLTPYGRKAIVWKVCGK